VETQFLKWSLVNLHTHSHTTNKMASSTVCVCTCVVCICHVLNTNTLLWAGHQVSCTVKLILANSSSGETSVQQITTLLLLVTRKPIQQGISDQVGLLYTSNLPTSTIYDLRLIKVWNLASGESLIGNFSFACFLITKLWSFEYTESDVCGRLLLANPVTFTLSHDYKLQCI